ncbi:MAG: hypothetical protein ACKPJF_23460, partial [Dolichospermum sp.]
MPPNTWESHKTKTPISSRGFGNLSNFPVGFFEIFGTGKTKFETTFLEGFMFQKNMAGNILTYPSPNYKCNLSVT